MHFNTILRVIRLKSLFLIFLLLPLSLHAEFTEYDYQDWKVTILPGFILYATHGTNVHGHRLGFMLPQPCTESRLAVFWSTSNDEIQLVEGTEVSLRISVGEASNVVSIPLLSVVEITPLYRALFFSQQETQFPLTSLLQQGDEATVSIESPETITAGIDILSDAFSLNGFTESEAKATELCESTMIPPPSPQRPQGSSAPTLRIFS